jgi:MoaA/NifB/PqqE/SkfB family radical SAM enzyme
MDGLVIELTNVCNRSCLHCVRNKEDAPEFFPLTLTRHILAQARPLGFKNIHLTGGEVALYPHLEEFLTLVVEQGFTFDMVTNGYRFRENLLPVLTLPKIREGLKIVCLSLDGAKPETHDALRGPGSFREVVEAAALCQFKEIPIRFKSVVTNLNKEELTDLALLGATLGAEDHGFIHPFPVPRMIREEIMPSPKEIRDVMEWISGNLAKMLRMQIHVEGFDNRNTLFECPNILKTINLDIQGNLALCCNLSHVTQEDGQPSVWGREWLADLKKVPLREGVIRHFHGVAELMEARVRDVEMLDDLSYIPCYWCFLNCGKLEWLRDYPESPWSVGLLEMERSYADA